MEVIQTPIADLLIIKPRVYEDERGFFYESYNRDKYRELGIHQDFCQDNQSKSSYGVVRGLHYQLNPKSQSKLVTVMIGTVWDVAVDLRKNSPTYGLWHGEILSEENGKIFWIPEGFAHGFLSIEENTKFLYKCTNYYNPESEQTILWNDPVLNINWNISDPIVSIKDKKGVIFDNFKSPF